MSTENIQNHEVKFNQWIEFNYLKTPKWQKNLIKWLITIPTCLIFTYYTCRFIYHAAISTWWYFSFNDDAQSVLKTALALSMALMISFFIFRVLKKLLLRPDLYIPGNITKDERERLNKEESQFRKSEDEKKYIIFATACFTFWIIMSLVLLFLFNKNNGVVNCLIASLFITLVFPVSFNEKYSVIARAIMFIVGILGFLFSFPFFQF